jgi:hypothetical protein
MSDYDDEKTTCQQALGFTFLCIFMYFNVYFSLVNVSTFLRFTVLSWFYIILHGDIFTVQVVGRWYLGSTKIIVTTNWPFESYGVAIHRLEAQNELCKVCASNCIMPH